MIHFTRLKNQSVTSFTKGSACFQSSSVIPDYCHDELPTLTELASPYSAAETPNDTYIDPNDNVYIDPNHNTYISPLPLIAPK